MVHHDFGPVVGAEAGGEEITHPQFGLCAVKERPVIQYPAHLDRLPTVVTFIGAGKVVKLHFNG